MLPFDRKPWAKTLAGIVVTVSFVAAVGLAFFFYDNGELHIPEVVGILLLLLTIVPPNVAILSRKSGEDASLPSTLTQTRHAGH
jgi:hypothetical protein